MANTPVINNFNAGELTPYLDARNDLKKYSTGCLELENFQILPYGGVTRRPALKYLGGTKGDKKARLVEFVFSTEQRFIIELTDLKMRFWKDGALVESAPDTPLEVATTWLEADLPRIRYVQSADVMWFVHPDYPVRRLSRLNMDGTSWTLEDESFLYPVFLDENVTDTTLTVPAAPAWSAVPYVIGDYVTESSLRYRCLVNHTGGTFATDLVAGKWVLDSTTGYTLTASDDLFDANHVGSFWKLRHVRPKTSETGVNVGTISLINPPTPSGTNNSIKVDAGETLNIYTTGEWAAFSAMAIWRSPDDGVTWEQFRYYQMTDRNVDSSWTEDQNKIRYCVTTTDNTVGTFVLSITEAYITGIVKITEVDSATSAICDVIDELGSTSATKYWSEGAWSKYRGYPSAITLHESRLVYANTLSRPNVLWLSTIDDFSNFRQTTLDDGSMTLMINSASNDEIKWLVSQHSLIIGTGSGEWALESESDNKAITPSAFSLKRKTTYGSNDIQGVMVNSAVLFVMRQGRKVREFVYNVDQLDYVAPDMTILAEHITSGGITDAKYVQQPDNLLVCLRADGTMILMTYERDQDVTGWQRWNNEEFEFESVAVLPKADAEDEIYVTVKMTIDGDIVRCVGVFDPREWGNDVSTEWNGSDLYKAYSEMEQDGNRTITVSGSLESGTNAEYTYDDVDERWETAATEIITKNIDGSFDLTGGLTLNYHAAPVDTVIPAKMIQNSVGSATTPVELTGEVKWIDSGTKFNGKTVFYDIDEIYAMWHCCDTYKITLIEDVGQDPGNYFTLDKVTVSGSGTIECDGDYYKTENDSEFYNNSGLIFISYDADNLYWRMYAVTDDTVYTYYICYAPKTYYPPKLGWVVAEGAPDAPTIDYVEGDFYGVGDWSGLIQWSISPEIYLTAGAPVISGLDHLIGKTVDVLIDGTVDAQKVVNASGEITVSRTGHRVVVGLPYTSTLAPMYIEPSDQFQQPMGKFKGVFKAVLRFSNTLSARVGQSKTKLETVQFRKTTDPMDAQIPLYTGDKTVNFNNQWKLLQSCYIVQDKPLPITVIAMIPWCEVN